MASHMQAYSVSHTNYTGTCNLHKPYITGCIFLVHFFTLLNTYLQWMQLLQASKPHYSNSHSASSIQRPKDPFSFFRLWMFCVTHWRRRRQRGQVTHEGFLGMRNINCIIYPEKGVIEGILPLYVIHRLTVRVLQLMTDTITVYCYNACN